LIWFVVILLGAVVVPLTVEWVRSPMTEARPDAAPGQIVLLSQGRTHFEWMGPERGPIAVCIHGLTTPSFVWRGLARGLALMGYRVLVYDHYGRGFSETVSGRQNADFFLRQLTDLLKNLEVPQPVTVIGYSMGGAIAAHFAARHPDAVKQLVLLAPAGMVPVTSPMLSVARGLPLIGDWLFLAVYPILLRRGIKAEAGLDSSVENITALQEAETDRRGYFPAVLSSLRGVLGNTAEEAHREIAKAGIPTLAIWGESDDTVPLEGKAVLAEWNPKAAQSVILGAGHGLTYTHTDDVIRILQAQLD